VIGNVGVLRGLLPFLEQQWATHGDVFRVRLPGTPAVIVAHPDLMQHVLLTKRENFVKGSVLDSLRLILGDGLVTLEGEAWKERRTLASREEPASFVTSGATCRSRAAPAFASGTPFR
jgi:cytochrome P450